MPTPSHVTTPDLVKASDKGRDASTAPKKVTGFNGVPHVCELSLSLLLEVTAPMWSQIFSQFSRRNWWF